MPDCLAELKGADRSLVVEYYAAEENTQIEHCRRLAEKVGKKREALMTHMSRFRDKLEFCVIKRFEARHERLQLLWGQRRWW